MPAALRAVERCRSPMTGQRSHHWRCRLHFRKPDGWRIRVTVGARVGQSRFHSLNLTTAFACKIPLANHLFPRKYGRGPVARRLASV